MRRGRDFVLRRVRGAPWPRPRLRPPPKTATTLVVEAKLASADPALLTVSESSAELAWNAATLLDYILYQAPGAAAISMTAIPVHSDSSVTKRHLVMTESNLLAYYIALTIENNTATTATIDLADEQLVNQTNVDNETQNMQPGPSGMCGVIYGERLVLTDGGSRVRVSEALFPHTFRLDVGYLDVGVNDGDSVRNVFVANGLLFIAKTQRAYYTEDNGSDPVDWLVREHSEQLGTPSPAGSDANEADGWVAVAGHNALNIVSGEAITEISRNVRPTWQSEMLPGPERVKVVVDPTGKRIFCVFPTGASGSACNVYVCDYTNGLKPDRVKWSRWITGLSSWQGVLIDTIGASA